MTALLEAKNLVKHFVATRSAFGRPTAFVKAVDGVSFSVSAGETLALVGESGCGKSTVSRLVLRLIEPDQGEIRFEGRDLLAMGATELRAFRRDAQIIFQDPYASLNPRMTVGQILAEPLVLHNLVPSDKRQQRVEELLRLVGLEPRAVRRYAHEFSGGQRQRIAIARALAVEPKLIICDEPVSALDVSIRSQILNLLRDLQQRLGLAYIFVSHDLAVVKHIADRVAVMNLGQIVETADAETLFASPRHPYSRALLSAIPVPTPHAKRSRLMLEGEMPSALNPPPGCRFHTRCPYVIDRCRTELPQLMPEPAGHLTACHRSHELPPADAIIPSDGGLSPALGKLIAAFNRMEGTANSGVGMHNARVPDARVPEQERRVAPRFRPIVEMENRIMRTLRLAVTAAALALSLVTSAQAQTTLRIGLAEDPDMLDPSLGRTYVGRIVFSAFCDKLFDIDEKLNIVPQLALSHETSADGKAVTIKLRPGVKFHDGEAFDAEAAKFSLDRHLTMPTSFRKPELAALDHVEVVDPLTIKLVLKTPFSPLISQLTDRAGMMVSPKAVKEQGDKFGLHPVCAGPYKFVERVQQDRIVFEKFADYWNKDNVFIDRIVYLPIVDATVRLANVKSGGLDLIERVLATDIKDVRADSRLALSSALELGYFGLTLNTNNDKTKGALTNVKVRQALDLSIDRDAINQAVFNGEFTPGNQWISPEHPYYQKAFPVRSRDIAKAKALLKEAGLTLPVSVDMMVPKGAENEAVAQVLQSMAAEAGIDLKIRLIEFATSFKQAQAGEFQAFLIGWSGRIDPDGNSYVFLHSGAPQNDGGYTNPEADKLMEDARLTSDVGQRKAIYEKLTKIILNDEPIIYLYQRKLLFAHTKKLEGYRQMPDGLVRVVGLKLK